SVAAGETLVLDREETRAMADAANVFVVATHDTPAPDPNPASAIAQDQVQLSLCGPVRARAPDLEDARRGIAVVSRVVRFATRTAAAAVRGHVVAVAAEEGASGLVGRLRVSQQWGLARLGGRRGTLVVARALGQPEMAAELNEIVATLTRTRFAGIAFWGE